MNKFDCWIYIIKNMEKLKEMPFVDKNPVFRMLAEIGDLRKLTPEERELYDEDIKVMRDLYATQKWEEEQKRMEIEKGRAEGREQGRAEGRAEGKLEIAKNLLAMGIPMDKVVQASGLTEEQISALMN
ncbi:PD-(D/E)XK nuclease family transposase [Segatella hominis]|uniref:PD-(D/E)XK nuclease family transposase n=1 Tax=Segatella hominis TaxID=2518605 RepID=UPI00294AB7E4|nr:PD-(D/E)XK nuclease family transposase [Segatella hominis]